MLHYFEKIAAHEHLAATQREKKNAGVGELIEQMPAPDVIVHATSSGGTLAGILAGCAVHGLSTRVIGVSADDPAAEVVAKVTEIVDGEPRSCVTRFDTLSIGGITPYTINRFLQI